MRSPTTAGYGSPSIVSQGATASTRSLGVRLYRICEPSPIAPEYRICGSLKVTAYAARLSGLDRFTPPSPL